MHRMHLGTAVLDVYQRHVSLADHEHRHVRIEVAVDRPPHPRTAFDEAGSATDQIVEASGGLRRVEAERGWRAVREQLQLLARLRWHLYVGALRSDDHRR